MRNRSTGRRAANCGVLVAAAMLAATVGVARAEEAFADPDVAAEASDAAAAKGKAKRRFVFAANDGGERSSVWITDGTAQGTKRLTDAHMNQVERLKAGVVLFSGYDYKSAQPIGEELWITDGTPKGTKLLKEIEPSVNGSNIGWLTAVGGGKAMFKADTKADGGELYVTDGTAKGIKLVKDIFPGFYVDPFVGERANSGTPWQITPLSEGRAIFAGQNARNNVELWISDGSAKGTRLVKEINPTGNSGASEFLSLGDGRATFYASDGVNSGELYVTDGTEKGTKLVKEINPTGSASIGSLHFEQQVLLKKGRSIFSAYTPTQGAELWTTDGTAAGTKLVKDIKPGLERENVPNSSNPQNMVAMGDGRALFAAADPANGFELFITNGAPAGTKMVKDINPGAVASGPEGFAPLGGGKFVFAATTAKNGRELWVTNGTAKGTKLVKDINPGSGNGIVASTIYTASLGDGRVLFAADDGVRGAELWVTDGTAKGTKLVKDINKGPDPSDASSFTPLD